MSTQSSNDSCTSFLLILSGFLFCFVFYVCVLCAYVYTDHLALLKLASPIV